MNKLYMLLGACSFAALPTMAQDIQFEDYSEYTDVTNLLQNPGFDEDITFTSDGQPKADITNLEEKAKMSARSWNWMTADGTLYARAITADEGNGTWSRSTDSYAYNGFLGKIKGWTLNTGNESSCEWVYFGSIPYDLGETAIPIADNGDTWMVVPTKPVLADNSDENDGDAEANKGALFLRAGWGGWAAYSQEVTLPCAKYALVYRIFNSNAEGSKSNTKYKNLCKVTCGKDVFEDSEGLNAANWEEHVIEFTPTSTFTIQFGYQSDGGSGSNPFLWIDDIRLYKTDEADYKEVVESEASAYYERIQEVLTEAGINNQTAKAVYEEIYDSLGYYESAISDAEDEECEPLLKDLAAYVERVKAVVANITTLQTLVEKADIALGLNYPGYDEYYNAISAANNAIMGGTSSEIAAQIDALNEATRAYYISQEAPADFTFLVSSPEFCISTAVPTYSDGVAEYPNVADYTAGTAPSDATSEGWNKGTVTSGDQRLNYAQGRICWNLWDSGKAGYHEVYQELKDIPNGKYTVSGDLITQSGCLADQHMYATSSYATAVSANLDNEAWSDNNDGTWSTLTTDEVIVVDGKLKIGAGSTFSGEGSVGWFCLSHVILKYLGEATEEEIASVIAAKLVAVQEQADTMHYAADKAALKAAIERYQSDKNIDTLNVAIAAAVASEADYKAVTAGTLKTLQDSLAAEAYSSYAKTLATDVVTTTVNYLGSAEATYTETASYTKVLQYYLNTLLPAVVNAQEVLNTVATAEAKAVLTETLDGIAKDLATFTKDETVLAAEVAWIADAVNTAEIKETAIADNTDMTIYMTNPNVEAETGWTFHKLVGNTNTATGQGVDGVSSNRYLDSWNGTAGALRYSAYQTLNVPNGTYKISNIMRNSQTGAYLFASTAAPVKDENGNLVLDATATNVISDAVLVQTPNKYINATDLEGEAQSKTDSYGEIWMAAADVLMAKYGIENAETGSIFDIVAENNGGNTTCPEGVDEATWSVFSANNGTGRGWFNNSVEITVTNHVLTVGVSTDSVFLSPTDRKAFTGTWFSADNFTLTMVKAGDNTDWDYTTGVEAVEPNDESAAEVAVYSISGARVNGMKQGINIVKYADGSVKKVLVK
ncbi:MAG: hypothetical protein K6E54_00215 [Bacteroidaceae bacterium]|nr:hypothetical protein [Bacteroidaceae bacterium]